jgi:hypothetical protein
MLKIERGSIDQASLSPIFVALHRPALSGSTIAPMVAIDSSPPALFILQGNLRI